MLAGLLAAGPGSANAVSVAAAGDISCPADSTAQNVIEPGREPKPAAAKCQGKRVAQMISDQNPDVTLALGDLIQGQTSYKTAYNDFRLAWDPIKVRIASTIGNHDYHRNANGVLTASGYFRYWEEQKVPTWSYGKRDGGWSSWNTGKWHMINLNSNCQVTDCTFTGPQLRWLINDLKEDRKDPATECTMAYFHHPLFSAGVPRGQTGDRTLVANLWELLYRYRTDLVVTGHQHFYERYFPMNPSGERDPTGITQIITGTGGASTFHPEDVDGQSATNSVTSVRSLGATFFDLEDNSFSSYFRDMLGEQHDPTPAKECLSPNAGAAERTPRAKRYTRHMKRMATLEKRVARLDRQIRKLRRDGASGATVKRITDARDSAADTRAELRVEKLY